jgi:NACalpha-BTF3-like transcription factor
MASVIVRPDSIGEYSENGGTEDQNTYSSGSPCTASSPATLRKSQSSCQDWNDRVWFVVVRAKVPFEEATLLLEAEGGHVWHAIDRCTEESEQMKSQLKYQVDDESRTAILHIQSQGGCSQEQAKRALISCHGDRGQASAGRDSARDSRSSQARMSWGLVRLAMTHTRYR